jgi:hypothetical protein
MQRWTLEQLGKFADVLFAFFHQSNTLTPSCTYLPPNCRIPR